MIINSDKVVALLRQVAAEEVMPRWQHLEEGDVSYKAGDEPVTIADKAAEKALAAGLTALLPGAKVVGEEAVADNRSLLELLRGDDWVWVVDPIDGTRNFSRGKAAFALMIALVRNGTTEGAWIYAPAMESLGLALRGEGAQLDGRVAAVPDNPAPPSGLRGTLHAGQFAPRELASRISKRRDRVMAERSYGSAGIEYLRLIGGELDFSFFSKLMPWDHAPGCLLLQEAGGVACFTDSGADYNPQRHAGEGLLLAPDREAWNRLHRTLLGEGVA